MSEREFSTSIAISKITNIINSLNLSAVTRYTDSSKLVATADLFKDKELIQSGAGKGPDCLAGALAESIEHFSTFQNNENTQITQDCEFIANQKSAMHDGFLTCLPHLKNSIESYRLTTLDKSRELFVPSTLLHPILIEREIYNATPNLLFLSRYSSNSGIAFGCTKAEALLHGVHEILERHILSCFFMTVCSISPTMELYSPSHALITKALQENPHALSLADELQIIVIKNLFNVYFSVAIPKFGPGDLHLSTIGSGCSLNICTAILRAVTEQFQVNALYDTSQEAADRKAFDFLSRSKTLRNLIDFRPVIDLNLPIIHQPENDLNQSVPHQLETLLGHLSKSGKTMFHQVIAKYSDDGIVCQAYIPGLERFNIIRSGILVAPQAILRQRY